MGWVIVALAPLPYAQWILVGFPLSWNDLKHVPELFGFAEVLGFRKQFAETGWRRGSGLGMCFLLAEWPSFCLIINPRLDLCDFYPWFMPSAIPVCCHDHLSVDKGQKELRYACSGWSGDGLVKARVSEVLMVVICWVPLLTLDFVPFPLFLKKSTWFVTPFPPTQDCSDAKLDHSYVQMVVPYLSCIYNHICSFVKVPGLLGRV